MLCKTRTDQKKYYVPVLIMLYSFKKRIPYAVPGIRFICYILSFYFLFHNLSIVSQLKYELYLRSLAQLTVYMDFGSVKHGSVFYD